MPRIYPIVLALVPIGAATAVWAQTASAPPSSTNDTGAGAAGSVVVTGKGSVTTSIDRRSYSVANDLQAANGSLADALRDIPSVQVDMQGNVSLRGDPSVTILINGLPASQFEGANRGDALQAFPANTVDRVEVMTNPSAEFTSQGAGGVINIITKARAKGAPASMTVRGGLGTVGRSQVSGSASFNAGSVAVSADANFRRAPRDLSAMSDTLTALPGQAAIADHYQSRNTGDTDSGAAGVKLGYQLAPRTSLSGQARITSLDLGSPGTAISLTGPSPAALSPDYSRSVDRSLRFDTFTVGAGLRQTFTGDQHELTFDYQHQSNTRRDATQTSEISSPSITTPAFEDVATQSPLNQDTFKLVYRRPMPLSGRLVLGYDRIVNDQRIDALGLAGASAGAAVPASLFANAYREDGVQQSFYGTYQQPIGHLTVLAGLRIETLNVKLRALGSPLPSVAETDIDPTLNATYPLNGASKLSFDYSRRLQRPLSTDYDPSLTYIDPSDFLQGDPGARTAKTDSFEGAYQWAKKGTSFSATVYYRKNADVLTTLIEPFSDDIYVEQRANAVNSRNGGLELAASGPILGTLSYDLSSDLYYSELHGGASLGNQSGTVLNGHANVNWSPTDADLWQLNAVAHGRYLAPQGYVAPQYSLNLGYRRKLADGLFLTATGQDVLGGFSRNVVATNAPSLIFRSTSRYNGPAGILSLSYTFGGAPGRKTAPDLDYGGGPAP